MKIGQASISYRLNLQQWESDAAFAATVAMIEQTAMAREFALFTNDTHTPPPLEEMERRFAILARRIPQLQSRGWLAGINHLCTLGHAAEDVVHAAAGGREFVAIDGRPGPGNHCPADPEWREKYVRPCYRMAAECRPDFIWIDDDVRLNNHGNPSDIGCFCPACLARLSDYLGFSGTLAELPAFFETADPAERRRRRLLLLAWNRAAMNDLARYIEQVVHGVDPTIILGQMDGYAPWCGLDYPGHAEALSGPRHTPVWWRPGGGVYTDARPDELLDKANSVGREAALLPDWVEVIEAELESFNYQQLNKSRFFTALEPQVYCAAGTTGVAYNIFGSDLWDPPGECLELVEQLNANREFQNLIVRGNQRTAPGGVFDGHGPDILLSNNYGHGPWLARPCHAPAGFCGGELQKIGLPAAYTRAEAAVYAIGEGTVQSMDDEAIRTMLARGAYLDGFALAELTALGYGEYLGFTAGTIIEADAIERFTDHPLNGAFAGRQRNARQSFWWEPAWSLVPQPGAEILSDYVDYAGAPTGACALGVFTNRLGGRIAVNGYYPWRSLFYRFKGVQLKNLFRWLSGDTLPGWVSSYHRAALWVREREGAFHNASVWNLSQDPARRLKLKLRAAPEELAVHDAAGVRTVLRAVADDGDCREFELPEIPAWSLAYCEAVKMPLTSR